MGNLNFSSFLATAILFFCCNIYFKGQDSALAKVKDFIPKSAIQPETRIFEGDLNRDNFEDIILRFKLENENEYQEHVHLLIGQKNGEYKVAAKNDSLELDNVDGTVFDKIVIKNGFFHLSM